jgi:hypothetical protein
MAINTPQSARARAADHARSRASDTVNKALQDVSATDEAKAARRETLTTYPPLVTEARDRNARQNSSEAKRDDGKPGDK